MTSALQRAVFAASRISGCGQQPISMRQLCRIVSNVFGTRSTAGTETASSAFRCRTIGIGPGIVFNRTVFIHTNRLDGETATNGRRVGMSGCSASNDLGRRTTRGGRLFCKQDSQVGSIPTRSTKFRQSRMRGRYAPLKTERAAFNSLGWHQSGNGVMAWHPCLGSTWSEFNSQFPDQIHASVPEGNDGLRYERSVRRFESCRALQNRATVELAKGIDAMLRTFKRDIVRVTTKRVIWGVVS